MKLLIIEDNDKMRNYIIQLLCEFNDQIIESDNGDEAIKLFETNNPDVVLMDIELKGLDGITAASRINANHPDAKIIFVTNYPDKEYKEKAFKAGGYAYVLKENLFELKKIVRELKTKLIN